MLQELRHLISSESSPVEKKIDWKTLGSPQGSAYVRAYARISNKLHQISFFAEGKDDYISLHSICHCQQAT